MEPLRHISLHSSSTDAIVRFQAQSFIAPPSSVEPTAKALGGASF
jgi:hypothetical protein